MGSSREPEESGKPRSRPATSPEAQENRMISLAVDLAEKQLAEGTAATPVVVHYLKLATVREASEREKLKLENELLKARTDQIGSQANSEAMYSEALAAMRSYSGITEEIID